jgi:hypothetical protein
MPRKRKPKMGRREKKANERNTQFLRFGVGKARLKAYQAAATLGFKGNVFDFVRTACDDLAARLAATEKMAKAERTAFLRAAADAFAAHLKRGNPPAEPPKGNGTPGLRADDLEARG